MKLQRIGFLGAAGLLLAALGCASAGRKQSIPPSALPYLRAASDAIDAGQFDKAREQLQAVKGMPQNAPLEEAIDNGEKRLLGAEFAEKIRKASILKIEPERVAFGQQALVTLEIKNPEQETIRFPAPQSPIPLLRDRKMGGMYGRLQELSVSIDAYGNQIRDKAERAFSTEEEIVIPPGQSWVQQARISPNSGEAVTLRSYQVLYLIRAPRVIIGEKETAFPNLAIGPATLQAMPSGFEPLAADPLGSMKKALAAPGEKFDAHVFLCAVLSSEEQKKAAVRQLAGALTDSDKARRRAVMAGLRWLTGAADNGFEEDRWTAWWESRRKEYEEQSAG